MITLLKLGGSLITNKEKPHSVRTETIRRVGFEIKEALDSDPDIKLILGHGSGSFGHVPASRYHTLDGVQTSSEWRGFAEVHAEADELNKITVSILRGCGLPILGFSPLSSVFTRNRKVTRWNIDPIFQSILHGLIPLIYGDTVLDSALGGTILSTEELFAALAIKSPKPVRILLAGIEEGIWKDYQKKDSLIKEMDLSDPKNTERDFIKQSAYTDVTGGMFSKVQSMEELIRKNLIQEALIFSGEKQGNIKAALLGGTPGTKIFRSV
ncbi:MAG TPA: isopentenyl phosphate kinase [Flexilinea sp.]|mgnify:FL=1|nr:isopentenyl phosphate kinase [Flexilinea sp.]